MGRSEPQLVAHVAESATCTTEILACLELDTLHDATITGVSTHMMRRLIPIGVFELESKDEAIICIDLDRPH